MDVEKLRETLRNRLVELNISAREASRNAGFNVGYVGDILDGRSKSPDPKRVLRLMETLEMDGTDLLGDSLPAPRPAAPSSTDTIPVYASTLPLNRQFLPFAAEPVGRIARPTFLPADAHFAFAALVPTNASAPRYMAGETVIVNPAATPAVGNFVHVKCKGGDAAIAQLESMGTDSFVLRFLGLEGDDSHATVNIEDVEAIGKIVGSIA